MLLLSFAFATGVSWALPSKDAITESQELQGYRLFGSDISHCRSSVLEEQKNDVDKTDNFFNLRRAGSVKNPLCAWIWIRSPEQVSFGRKALSFEEQGLETLTRDEAVKVFGKAKASADFLELDFQTGNPIRPKTLNLILKFSSSGTCCRYKFDGLGIPNRWFTSGKLYYSDSKRQEGANSPSHLEPPFPDSM